MPKLETPRDLQNLRVRELKNSLSQMKLKTNISKQPNVINSLNIMYKKIVIKITNDNYNEIIKTLSN